MVVAKAVRAGLALGAEHIFNRYVTEEQRSCRSIFIATLRAVDRTLSGGTGCSPDKATYKMNVVYNHNMRFIVLCYIICF
jgi:hypothetical protein